MSLSNARQSTILVVDDTPANIDVIEETLSQTYLVQAAVNGKIALKIIERKKPDLILLDIMMPEMDGYEVCQRIKADESTKDIPVIFLTAKTGVGDETKGLSLGAVDYITKPIRPSILKARIRTHLELKEHRERLEDIVAERTEELRLAKDEEIQLLEMTTALSCELNLGRLLGKIMETTKELLSADRCTLFLHDEKTGELWSQVAQGLETTEIRFPSHVGIAGSVFTSGKTVNIPDAYKDDRFNPDVDKKTGYKTNSILCMPIRNKKGNIIGATQVLNKKGGPFAEMDERRLTAFSAQVSMALENAKLFEDVLNMKNYNESMLESMSNGMISLDADKRIVKCNAASARILGRSTFQLVASHAGDFFSGPNSWVMESIEKVFGTGLIDMSMDTDLVLDGGTPVSVNLTVVPLMTVQNEFIGCLLVLEDITREKRLRGTMARYMTKEVADKLLEGSDAVLGGQTHEATILFSDIRNFTTISEKIGPQKTVTLLNDYFGLIVDIIFRYQGILDKYIGDALLAVFGAPFSSGEDPDRAVKTAIEMMTALKRFNKKRMRESKEPISIGTGISTDEVLSGNIGSIKRMDYTVIGDGVNLASRLEGANKIYGTNILISEYTHKGLKDKYISREVDLIRAKGKNRPVSVYQILDYYDDDEFPHVEDVIDMFHRGLSFYRKMDFRDAARCFEKALRLNENDMVSKIYLERCGYFAKSPPADDWDCVWIMESK